MKIKKSAFFRRTVTAQLTFEDEGTRKTEGFRIVYRSMTPARSREVSELQDQAKTALEQNPNDAEAKKAYARALAMLVESIPDIVEDDDVTPIKIDGDVLDDLFDWQNLNAINSAIMDDVNPKQQPSEV